MAMDRLLERLAPGRPPLRVHEVADLIGYSRRYVRKLLSAGAISAVRLEVEGERRVPVTEALRLARQLHILD